MDLDNSTYSKLAAYIANELPAEERASLEEAMEKDMHIKQAFNELSEILGRIPEEKPEFDSNQAFLKLTKNLETREKPSGKDFSVIKPKKNYLTLFFKVAAVFVVLLSSVLLINWLTNEEKTLEYVVYENTSNEPKRIMLKDGSEVWLSIGSSISYNKNFIENRTLSLNGKAFFNVAHNPEKIFSISLAYGEIQVLGTSFNVTAPSGTDQVLTTVLDGKVSYNNEEISKPIFLEKGDQLTWNIANEKATIEKIGNPAEKAAWRFSHLTFTETQLIDVVKKIEESFGVDVSIETKGLENCKITSDFSGKTLEEMLKEIDFLFETQSQINKKQILIQGGSTCEN